MNNKLINAAGNALSFDKTVIKKSTFELGEKFSSTPPEDTGYQAYKSCVAYDEHELEKEDDNDDAYLYVFLYEVGTRIVDKKSFKEFTELPTEERENNPFIPLAEIQATYFVYYNSKVKLESEAAIEFGKYNVGYHVWPFWREYVQSTSLRMNIPVINISKYIIDN
jgi:hypothetical protein